MLRVTATEVLAQSVLQNRNPISDEDIPIGLNQQRVSRLAEVEQNLIEFVTELLLDYDLPSTPVVRIGNIHGFEDIRKDFKDVTGVGVVHVTFFTISGQKIHLDLPVPLYKGEFQRPSIVVHADKKQVFSKDYIETLVKATERVRPIVTKPLDPTVSFQHQEVTERPLFSAPNDPSGWSLLVSERY